MKLLSTIFLLSFSLFAWSQYYPDYVYTNTEALNNIIWEEDFNRDKWISTVELDSLGFLLDTNSILNAGWRFVDSTDNSFYWHWSDVGPRGRYTSWTDDMPTSFEPNNEYLEMLPDSTSLDNGFMLMESDYFNTDSLGEMVSQPLDMHSYFEFGPLDFSACTGVIFNCKIFDRLCCAAGGGSRIDLDLSFDYRPNKIDGHWIDYELSIHSNAEWTYEYDRDFFVNVSSSAAGHDSVYFRITKKEASHFFAIIDDIKFYEAPKRDLTLTNAWVELFNVTNSETDYSGGYSMIPQVVSPILKQYTSGVSNDGSAAANKTMLQVEITKDSLVLQKLQSNVIIILPYEKDTFKIVSDFVPVESGMYQVSMSVNADGVDEWPIDNAWVYNFEVTDNSYSRVRHGKESEFGWASNRDWVYSGYDGDMFMVKYEIPENKEVEFSGVSVFVSSHEDEALEYIKEGGFKMTARVFKYEEERSEYFDANIKSEEYTIRVDDTSSWVYLPMVDEGELLQDEGDYFVGIEMFTGQNPDSLREDYLRFKIGSDEAFGLKQPYRSCVWYSLQNESWYGSGKSNYAIDLMVNVPDSITLTINYDMSFALEMDTFNPDLDTVFVTGSFNGWSIPGSANTFKAVYDHDYYQAVVKIPFAKDTIESRVLYKGFLNSGWERGEWLGDPNHVVVLKDVDVVASHSFGGHGDPWPDNVNSLFKDEFQVFPNPFCNSIMVNNIEGVDELLVVDTYGKLLLIKQNVGRQLEMQTKDLSSGVYFIVLKKNQDVVEIKRIVKQ